MWSCELSKKKNIDLSVFMINTIFVSPMQINQILWSIFYSIIILAFSANAFFMKGLCRTDHVLFIDEILCKSLESSTCT